MMKKAFVIVAVLVLALLGTLFAVSAAAQTDEEVRVEGIGHQDETGETIDVSGLGTPTTLDRARHGGLLLRTQVAGVFLPAPTLDTEITIVADGLVAEAEVRQRFHNPTNRWVEAVYVFPLPENAAVDRLFLTVGDRVIEGEIQERAAARQTFVQARIEGRRAALVEQQRPNLFTTEVTNLGPGEEVEVRIGFRLEARFDDGTFELRFPLVVAPRFHPPAPARDGTPSLTPAPPMIEPPRLAAADTPPNVRLGLTLRPGFDLARLGSVSHAVDISRSGDTYRVSFTDGSVPADRDFIFAWQPDVGEAVETALLTETLDGETYALLMLVPPALANANEPRLPRETVFVIDVSGSMGGPSIVQAKAALDHALARLDPADHFNMIAFAQTALPLFPTSVPAASDLISQARRWVAALSIRGGTMMRPALELALATDGVDRGLRQVIFVTDGEVANEDELFTVIDQLLGDSRLFTVGIGSAPNSHFMAGAARFGRGTFTHIGDVSEVAQRMGALYRKLERPVLSDVELRFDDLHAEMWPERVGDLYAGEPLVVAARLPSGGTGVTVRALRAGTGFERRVSAVATTQHQPTNETPVAGIARLWARRAIGALRDGMLRGADQEATRAAIIELALHHHLVTDFTSLVAVDQTPVAPADVLAQRHSVPLPLPAGWQGSMGLAALPATATPFRLLLLTGLLFAVAAMGLRRPRRWAGR